MYCAYLKQSELNDNRLHLRISMLDEVSGLPDSEVETCDDLSVTAFSCNWKQGETVQHSAAYKAEFYGSITTSAKAQEVSKLISRIDVSLSKQYAEDGEPADGTEYLLRVCKALGIKRFYVVPEDRYYKENGAEVTRVEFINMTRKVWQTLYNDVR